MGGNPFAQMMGGMMGGGGPGAGGPGGMGGGPRGPGAEDDGSDNEELTREIRKLRDEVHDVRRSLDRIADALED
jgi:50S ribosomal subunit-associated GTPase HflX